MLKLQRVLATWTRLSAVALSIGLIQACGGGSDEESSAPVTENRAPSISGSPSTQAQAGTQYLFAPQASDPDGDALSFSIQNAPDWSNFDATTGRLTGSPSSADIGTYANVTIRVSDGLTQAQLPAFTITVSATSSGGRSVTLSWMPPTTRVDGTSLNNLASYRIGYGTRAGVYPNTIMVNNPGLTSYVIDNLSPGTYHFVIVAIDADGLESNLSNPASKVIS
jgi:hypothetical protein